MKIYSAFTLQRKVKPFPPSNGGKDCVYLLSIPPTIGGKVWVYLLPIPPIKDHFYIKYNVIERKRVRRDCVFLGLAGTQTGAIIYNYLPLST